MPGGFWIFLLIVVANLVVTIIKKTAEKRAAAAGASGDEASTASSEPPPRRFKGEGEHEMVLERAGDHRIGVIEILRKELRWDLPTAMTLAGTTPSVVATGLTRSEAGYLRNRFESVGAGVSVRRKTADSISTARDLDLGRPLDRERRLGVESVPRAAASPRDEIRTEPAPGRDRASRRVEALRRRQEAPPRIAREPSPARAQRRDPTPSPPPRPTRSAPPTVSPDLAAKAEMPDLPAPRAARLARRERWSSDEGAVAAVGASLGRRIRGVTRDRRALREAFLLQELLRPPLSLRSMGCGGRDS